MKFIQMSDMPIWQVREGDQVHGRWVGSITRDRKTGECTVAWDESDDITTFPSGTRVDLAREVTR